MKSRKGSQKFRHEVEGGRRVLESEIYTEKGKIGNRWNEENLGKGARNTPVQEQQWN